MDRPTTQYARSGDYHIAYQVLGEGPPDLVYVPGWISHLDLYWEQPSIARFLRGLASFSRLIIFDKRGIGLSDPVPASAMPNLEERTDDVRAILDAVGSEQAVILGQGYGCPIAMCFAASHPALLEVRPTEFQLHGRDFLHFHDAPAGVVADGVRGRHSDGGTREHARVVERRASRVPRANRAHPRVRRH